MSYVVVKRTYNTIVVSDFDFSTEYISILNNSSITFDVSDYKIESHLIHDKTYDVFKVVIDYGDGNKETISQPIKKPTSTLSSPTSKNWNIFTHEFHFDKEYVYDEKLLSKNLPFISIKLYAVTGEYEEKVIHYKVLYKSLYELGTEFDINSSNLTAQNTVSYVMTKRDTGNMILVNTKDWKKIYGNENQVIVSNPSSLKTYTEQWYQDTDASTWDWKTKPFINWIKEPTESESGTEIYFSWKQGGVIFENLELRYKLISERNWTKEDITDIDEYTINKNFKSDVLEMYFYIEGDNGLKVETDHYFFRGSECNKGNIELSQILDGSVTVDQTITIENILWKFKFTSTDISYIDEKDFFLDLYFIDDNNDEKVSSFTVPFKTLQQTDETFKVYKKLIASKEYTRIDVRFLVKGVDDEKSNSYNEVKIKELYGAELINDYSASLSSTGIVKSNNVIHIPLKTSPEGPLELNQVVKVTDDQGFELISINLPYNQIFYSESDDGLKHSKNDIDVYIDGTLIPNGNVTLYVTGCMSDPTLYPDNGKSFSGEYSTPWSYPKYQANIDFIKVYYPRSNKDTGEYSFDNKTILYINQNPENRQEHADTITVDIYQNDEIVRTVDMSELSTYVIDGFNYNKCTQVIVDNRDTIYKRKNVVDYTIPANNPSSSITNKSVTFQFDPLNSSNYIASSQFIDVINQETSPETYTEVETNIVFYNTVKNSSLHKIIAKYTKTIILKNADGVNEKRTFFKDSSGILYEQKKYRNRYYNLDFIRYNVVTDPRLYLNEELKDGFTEIQSITSERFLNTSYEYVTITIGDREVNYQVKATFSIDESIMGNNPCERTITILDNYTKTLSVINLNNLTQNEKPFVLLNGHSYTVTLYSNDRTKTGDVIESWLIEPALVEQTVSEDLIKRQVILD